MTGAAAPVTVFVSAGSNIDPVTNLRRALAQLAERYGRLQTSPVYRSAPVGFAGDDFLNLVVAFRTTESPERIVAFMEALHRRAGRDRAAPAGHTLDLDLLLYGELVRQDGIRLPRPDILRYAFVLAPLADLAPALRHPETGRTIGELWAAFDQTDQPVSRVSDGLDGLD